MPRLEEPDEPQYWAARLRRALAEDSRTTELGVRVDVRGHDVHLTGEVASAERRDELDRVVQEQAPGLALHNDVKVSRVREPEGREDLT